MTDEYPNFDEYIRQGEPDKREKAGYWQTAIGLQAVDGLKVSNYLQDTARKHIEGDITIDEVRELVNQYYIIKNTRGVHDDSTEEADRVSSNIVKVLSSSTFDFSTGGYQSVHRRVFEGVMKDAGELRTYDIIKKEWVLEGDTVLYLNWED
ncbi:MAG: cell filamentation protein Fic, partial [Bacteroidales bacterium]|nr:cell filamentation protein Fic [Bacteroidales bacterium]